MTTPLPQHHLTGDDQDLMALTRQTLEQIAADIDAAHHHFQMLQERTITDMLYCHRLVRQVEAQGIAAEGITERLLNQLPRIHALIKHTLAAIARETAVRPDFQHPLQPETLASMRRCFQLLSEREQLGPRTLMRPHFIDEAPPVASELPNTVIPVVSWHHQKKSPPPDAQGDPVEPEIVPPLH